MNYNELLERCKDRVYDQIVIAAEDAFKETSQLRRIYHFEPEFLNLENGTAWVDGAECAYSEYVISGWIGDIELVVIQPVSGETIYKKYLDRFGTGICCLREQILASEFDSTCGTYEGRGLKVGQCGEGYRIFDLMDDIGILYAIHAVDEVKAVSRNDRKICQINITCPDVEEMAVKLAKYFEIGPYEIGHINNQTVGNLGIFVDGEMQQPEFEYLLGMNLCGNIEIETISPVKGPNCFADFINERPIGGYNHLKEVVPLSTGKWQKEIEHYEDLGMQQCIKGKIGPCGWCFVDTMKEIGFLVELGDGEPMTKLPDGYNAYFIPEKD